MATDLPARGRKLLHEDDLPRHLLIREGLGRVLPALGLERLGAVRTGARDDDRADEVPAALEVANADDRRRCNRRVPGEDSLDVERPERAAAARDDVLGASDEGEDSLLVDLSHVPREVPVAEEGGLR